LEEGMDIEDIVRDVLDGFDVEVIYTQDVAYKCKCSREKIETTLHAHTYNLIDAVLKNYTKDESLGKMDLSHIFPPNGLDYKIIEEYFDCFCGIHGQHLRKVNQSKFKGLFEKYQPIEYSSN
jgi:uncharacterized protein YvpB